MSQVFLRRSRMIESKGDTLMKRYGRSKSTMTGLVAVSGLLVGLDATPAAAQNAGANAETPQQGVLQEVVVSARREQESVQDIPTSITAFTPEQLEQHQLTSTQDLEEFTPNLRIDVGARAVNADFSIRGVTAQGAGGAPTTNPAVGQYINGVYVGSRIVNVMSTLDIERIEVLRGPQGTLFGKNTTAGAVNIVTRRPGKDAEGEVMLRTGSHNREDARLVVNAPIGDTLFARAAIGQDKDDGYYHNLTYNSKASDRNVKTYQAALRWIPTDDLTFDATWSYMDQNENNRGGDCRFVQVTGFQTLYNNLSGDNFEARCRESEAAGRYNFYADERQFLRADSESITGEAAWEGGEVGFFDDLGVTAEPRPAHVRLSFRGRRRHDERAGRDARPLRPGDVPAGRRIVHRRNGQAREDRHRRHHLRLQLHRRGRSRRRSEEPVLGAICGCRGHRAERDVRRRVRLLLRQQPAQHDRLRRLAIRDARERLVDHARHLHAHQVAVPAVVPARDRRALHPGPQGLLQRRRLGDADQRLPRLHLGAERRHRRSVRRGLDRVQQDHADRVAEFHDARADRLPRRRPDYLLWSRGFQSGGFNTELEVSRIPQLAPLLVFKPETLDNYEVGIKTTMLDRRLRVNLALFQMKYKDKQEAINIDNANGEFGPNTAIEVIQNAAKATIEGYELEFQALLGAGFSIDGGLARQKPEYTDYNVFDPETGRWPT